MKGVESILQRKREKTKTKRPRKHIGGIHATDEKYTGLEPTWEGWQEWDTEKFWRERLRGLHFYNYYASASELKPNAIEWMERSGYTKEQVKAVRSAPDYYPGVTISSLCRMLNRGMPPLHPKLQEHIDSTPGLSGTAYSDEVFIRDGVAQAIAEGQKEINIQARKESTGGGSTGGGKTIVSPMILLKRKIQATIILELDLLLDKWLDTPKGKPVEKLDLFERIRHHSLPAMGLGYVEEWLKRQKDEHQLALDGTNEDVAQAYSFLSKDEKVDRIEVFKSMLDDVNRAKHSAKAQRAPREKKLPAATKQVSKLQYLKDCPEYKITSINPVRIVGAYRVFAFHVKERTLIDLTAQTPAGIQIKGTTLQNIDMNALRSKRLRKPEEFLPTVLNGTPKQIDNGWEKLTTVQVKPTCRINKDMILVRVFEQKQ